MGYVKRGYRARGGAMVLSSGFHLWFLGRRSKDQWEDNRDGRWLDSMRGAISDLVRTAKNRSSTVLCLLHLQPLVHFTLGSIWLPGERKRKVTLWNPDWITISTPILPVFSFAPFPLWLDFTPSSLPFPDRFDDSRENLSFRHFFSFFLPSFSSFLSWNFRRLMCVCVMSWLFHSFLSFPCPFLLLIITCSPFFFPCPFICATVATRGKEEPETLLSILSLHPFRTSSKR